MIFGLYNIVKTLVPSRGVLRRVFFRSTSLRYPLWVTQPPGISSGAHLLFILFLFHLSKVFVSTLILSVLESSLTPNFSLAHATPGYMDALTGLWRGLEWLHAEVGIAFGVDRPGRSHIDGVKLSNKGILVPPRIFTWLQYRILMINFGLS